jgi:hypothetical protein
MPSRKSAIYASAIVAEAGAMFVSIAGADKEILEKFRPTWVDPGLRKSG